MSFAKDTMGTSLNFPVITAVSRNLRFSPQGYPDPAYLGVEDEWLAVGPRKRKEDMKLSYEQFCNRMGKLGIPVRVRLTQRGTIARRLA